MEERLADAQAAADSMLDITPSPFKLRRQDISEETGNSLYVMNEVDEALKRSKTKMIRRQSKRQLAPDLNSLTPNSPTPSFSGA